MRLIVLLLLLLPLAGCLDDPAPSPVDSDPDGYTDAATWPAWGDLDAAVIRPGASLGGYCTFNFLFEAPDGTGYIGTAGHCTDEIGERLTLDGVGEIATVVYDSDLVESGVDFSLAQLDADRIADAHPQMFGWHGPTGSVVADDLAVGDEIQLHGYGLVLGQNDVTRDRFGVLVDWTEDEYNVDMPAVNGDSGSPLLHESGKAFGIISRYGFDNTPPSTDRGPLMDYIFRELDAAGLGDVRLVTIGP